MVKSFAILVNKFVFLFCLSASLSVGMCLPREYSTGNPEASYNENNRTKRASPGLTTEDCGDYGSGFQKLYDDTKEEYGKFHEIIFTKANSTIKRTLEYLDINKDIAALEAHKKPLREFLIEMQTFSRGDYRLCTKLKTHLLNMTLPYTTIAFIFEKHTITTEHLLMRTVLYQNGLMVVLNDLHNRELAFRNTFIQNLNRHIPSIICNFTANLVKTDIGELSYFQAADIMEMLDSYSRKNTKLPNIY